MEEKVFVKKWRKWLIIPAVLIITMILVALPIVLYPGPLYPNDAIMGLIREQEFPTANINNDLKVELRTSPSADSERINLIKLGMPLIGYKLSTLSQTSQDNYVGVVIVILSKDKAESDSF